MAENKVQYSWFDETHISKTKTSDWMHNEIRDFVCKAPFGLEIDLDAIAGMGSSAVSPLGCSAIDCLQFVKTYAAHKNCGYIHLCEGAPNRELHDNQVGKILAYLVTSIFN
jgi:formiminoglutamase